MNVSGGPSWLERAGGAGGGADLAEAERRLACFGKYKGKTVKFIVQNDPTYAAWMVNVTESPKLRQALRLVLNANDDLVKAEQRKAEALRR